MSTNPGCIYSTACSGQDGGHRKQWCLWPLFWQPPEPKAGNPRGQSVPCWLHWKLQNMFMSTQQELPRLVMPLLSLLSRLLEGAASKSKPTFKSVEGTACSWILPAQSHLPAISPMHPGHLKVKGRQGCLSAPLPPPCWKGQPFLCSSKFQQRSRTQCHLISNPPTLTARPGNSR